MVTTAKQRRAASIPELTRFKRNLKTLAGEVAKVQKPVDRTYLAVHGAKAVLGQPRKLSRSMKWIASKSDTLSDSALFLMPFPIIGTLASRLATVLRSVKSKAERAKRAADKLDRRFKPAKDAVARIIVKAVGLERLVRDLERKLNPPGARRLAARESDGFVGSIRRQDPA